MITLITLNPWFILIDLAGVAVVVSMKEWG